MKRHILLVPIALVFAACANAPAPEEAVEDHHEEAATHQAIHLDDLDLEELGITIATAGPGELSLETELPGEVRINGDRLAHVTPKVGGSVREVHKSLGDSVRRGEVLAVLESRDLADAKAAYLAARERLGLSEALFQREERLWERKITSEQDFLDARNARAEARIEVRTGEQKLYALGLEKTELAELPQRHEIDLTRYAMTAPFAGTIVEKHLTLGETVEADTPVFTVADLTSVWVDLSIYQRDIGFVNTGDTVILRTNHGDEATAAIDFVQPIVGEETRTALARLVLSNTDGVWHPGCFVTARAVVDAVQAEVAVPRSAVQQLEGAGHVVFVVDGDELDARPVELGRGDADRVEILGGLSAGERYATTGTFVLKAELGKGAFGAHVH